MFSLKNINLVMMYVLLFIMSSIWLNFLLCLNLEDFKTCLEKIITSQMLLVTTGFVSKLYAKFGEEFIMFQQNYLMSLWKAINHKITIKHVTVNEMTIKQKHRRCSFRTDTDNRNYLALFMIYQMTQTVGHHSLFGYWGRVHSIL